MRFLERNFRFSNTSARFLFIFAAFGVLVMGASYFYRTRKPQYKVMVPNPDGSSSLMDFSLLEGITLVNLKAGEPEGVTLTSSCNTLVIIFSPGDCPSCLREKLVWESLARSYNAARFQVIGIIIRASAEEAETITKALNVPFTIYYDKRNDLKQRSLAPQVTPFKILFGGRKGILLAAGPNNRVNEQEQFGEKVRSSLEDCRQ